MYFWDAEELLESDAPSVFTMSCVMDFPWRLASGAVKTSRPAMPEMLKTDLYPSCPHLEQSPLVASQAHGAKVPSLQDA